MHPIRGQIFGSHRMQPGNNDWAMTEKLEWEEGKSKQSKASKATAPAAAKEEIQSPITDSESTEKHRQYQSYRKQPYVSAQKSQNE